MFSFGSKYFHWSANCCINPFCHSLYDHGLRCQWSSCWASGHCGSWAASGRLRGTLNRFCTKKSKGCEEEMCRQSRHFQWWLGRLGVGSQDALTTDRRSLHEIIMWRFVTKTDRGWLAESSLGWLRHSAQQSLDRAVDELFSAAEACWRFFCSSMSWREETRVSIWAKFECTVLILDLLWQGFVAIPCILHFSTWSPMIILHTYYLIARTCNSILAQRKYIQAPLSEG